MNKKKKIVIRAVFISCYDFTDFFLFQKGYEYCDEVLNFGKNYFGIFFIPVVFIVFWTYFLFFGQQEKENFVQNKTFFYDNFSYISFVAFYRISEIL